MNLVIDVDVRAKQAKPLEIGGSAYSQGENIRHALLWEKSHEYRDDSPGLDFDLIHLVKARVGS